MSDELIHFLLPKVHSRGVIIRGTHILAEAARIHGLGGALARRFGEALLGSILLLSINKGGVRQVLQLDGAAEAFAPIRRMFAETRLGRVRGYLDWREEGVGMLAGGGETLSEWLGRPIRVSTVRDLGIGQPYVSVIEDDADHLADLLVHYLHQSVQTRADVVLRNDLAMLIEAMPGCDDARWFEAVQSLAAIPDRALDEQPPQHLLRRFEPLGCRIISSDEYAYRCDCSIAEIRDAIASMPADQLAALADARGKVRISCRYCDKSYQIDAPEAPA